MVRIQVQQAFRVVNSPIDPAIGGRLDDQLLIGGDSQVA
jgi:hypothetical protein